MTENQSRKHGCNTVTHTLRCSQFLVQNMTTWHEVKWTIRMNAAFVIKICKYKDNSPAKISPTALAPASLTPALLTLALHAVWLDRLKLTRVEVALPAYFQPVCCDCGWLLVLVERGRPTRKGAMWIRCFSAVWQLGFLATNILVLYNIHTFSKCEVKKKRSLALRRTALLCFPNTFGTLEADWLPQFSHIFV